MLHMVSARLPPVKVPPSISRTWGPFDTILADVLVRLCQYIRRIRSIWREILSICKPTVR